MKTDWPSTKALSVYSALSIAGRDMTPSEIGAFLREAWDPTVDDEYVSTGEAFLLQRRFVKRIGKLLTIQKRHAKTRMGKPLVRSSNDAELVYGRGQ